MTGSLIADLSVLLPPDESVLVLTAEVDRIRESILANLGVGVVRPPAGLGRVI